MKSSASWQRVCSLELVTRLMQTQKQPITIETTVYFTVSLLRIEITFGQIMVLWLGRFPEAVNGQKGTTLYINKIRFILIRFFACCAVSFWIMLTFRRYMETSSGSSFCLYYSVLRRNGEVEVRVLTGASYGPIRTGSLHTLTLKMEGSIIHFRKVGKMAHNPRTEWTSTINSRENLNKQVVWA